MVVKASSDVDETWDLAPPPLPPRSRLYHLAPIGVGHPYVESLTSYLARLSAAHAVLPRALALGTIAPLLGIPTTATERGAFAGYFYNRAHALDGMEETSRRWVSALETLTERRDLRHLTLLPWAAVLTPWDLLRTTATWCPDCYEVWLDAGRTIYRPLLWSFRTVTVCPRHRRPLWDRCPHLDCRQQQLPVSFAARPGHCVACGRWLGAGAASAPADQIISDDTLTWQDWVVDALGALLSAPVAIARSAQHQRVTAALRACAAHVGGGETLARLLGVSPNRPSSWMTGDGTPSLAVLLRLCHYFGTTPLHLFTDDSVALVPSLVPPPTVEHRHYRIGAFDLGRARELLAAALREPEHPPPSVRALARRLNCDDRLLRYHQPEACRTLSARFLEYRRRRSGASAAQRH